MSGTHPVPHEPDTPPLRVLLAEASATEGTLSYPELQRAIEERDAGEAAALSPSTRSQYGYAVQAFLGFCAALPPPLGPIEDPFELVPADAEALLRFYLGRLASSGGRDGEGRRPDTWDVHIAGIRRAYIDAERADPTAVDAKFKATRRGLRVLHSAGEKNQAPPLLLEDLVTIREALDRRAHRRLQEALAVALHGAGVSPATIARCRLETTTVDEAGAVTLRPDGGRHAEVVVEPTGREGCAAALAARLQAITGPDSGAPLEGPLVPGPARMSAPPHEYRRHHARYLRWRTRRLADGWDLPREAGPGDLVPDGPLDAWLEDGHRRGLAPTTLEQYRRAVNAILAPRPQGPPRSASPQYLTTVIVRAHSAAGGKSDNRTRLPTWADLSQVDAAVAATLAPTLQEERDWSIVCTGWHLSQRRSNLSMLNWQDVGDGFGTAGSGLEVVITRSKSDQEGEGRIVGVLDLGPGYEHVDGAVALRRYRAALEAHVGALDGRWPIYVKVNSAGTAPEAAMPDLDEVLADVRGRRRRAEATQTARAAVALSGQAIADTVDRLAQQAGLDHDPATGSRRRYTGHSLRRGWITWAVRSGMTLEQVMAHTGHESHEVAWEYVEAARALGMEATAAVAAEAIRQSLEARS